MLGRERREERREDRSPGGASGGGGDNRYQMVQKMVSIGDDFWIENGRGEKVYKVDGKALRVRSTLIFEDRNGQELCKIQEKMLRVRDTMDIEDASFRLKVEMSANHAGWTLRVSHIFDRARHCGLSLHVIPMRHPLRALTNGVHD